MGVLSFKVNKRNSHKQYFESYSNENYKGNNVFCYEMDGLKYSLNVIRKISSYVNSSDFYMCTLHCSDGQEYNENYGKIIASMNLDIMKHSSEYTKFVFEHVFNKENIKSLSKSYYVGSVFMNKGHLIFNRDEEVYRMYYTGAYRKKIELIDELCNMRDQLKSTYSSSNTKIR